MWAIRNKTAHATDRTWIRDPDGLHHWIVAIKATFDLDADGALTPAEDQLPPLLEPEYLGEPGRSSLRYEVDLCASKPGVDLIVNATAHAPGGHPTPEVRVGLRAGPIDKQLLVRGPARYTFGPTGLRVTRPEPFVTQAIVYEHAWGGSDELAADPRLHGCDLRNPIGCGFAMDQAHLHQREAPRVYYPSGAPERAGPAGFGALPSHWSPRLELAGTYDERWAATKRPLLPDDWNPACLHYAPFDQRLPTPLRSGEVIELTNLSARGSLRFELPELAFMVRTRFGRREERQLARASAVIIEPQHEPDRHRLILVWQATRFVPAPEADYLDESIVEAVR
ncbi:DUF2169 domain-containing protein [Pseudenhygromyxa sp. WMMC2535]|uniref:DUF2169 family type VI secretion system accessory protein n=1 Tax=Pseudenhygromyxa sp. WMMC2535 TaxID=2712867 RepID=UPI001557035C|nr:DUF2169 domain-containing protein [Pseudenhygromyxa sp. WMMC2535]NVB38894.1 DUF2169 domain-containing protein [Pseudenhygromyxa sp. WMMC2535]